MQQRQPAPHRPSLIESLESRTMLSVTPTTTTTLKVSTTALDLGQSVTVSYAVKGSKHSGKLVGTVEILDNGTPIMAAGNTLGFGLKNGKGSYRFGPGDAALFTGTNQITAEFVSNNALPDSTSATDTVTVTEPALTTTSDGLGIATFGKGKGKAIKAGQEAQVLYTGFLAATGAIFDYATAHAPPFLKFEVGVGAVIQGFDEGTVGMKVGQSRVLDIPADIGYGATANGSIPANSELIFLVTLQKISKA